MELIELIEHQKLTPLEERVKAFFNRFTLKDAFTKSEKYLQQMAKEELIDNDKILKTLELKKIVSGRIVRKVGSIFIVEIDKSNRINFDAISSKRPSKRPKEHKQTSLDKIPEEGILPSCFASIFTELGLNYTEKLIGSCAEFEIVKISMEPFLIVLKRNSLQRNPEQEKMKQEIMINEITKTFQKYVSDDTKSKAIAKEIIETVEEKIKASFLQIPTKYDIKDILNQHNSDIFDDLKDNDYLDDGPYCSACQEAPCMCSDPERTSTTWGY